MRNAECDLRQTIGDTLPIIAETLGLIRDLDSMDAPLIGRENRL